MITYIYYGEGASIVKSEYDCCAKVRKDDELDSEKYYIKFQDGLILNPYKRVSIKNKNYKMLPVTKPHFDRYINFLVERKEHQLTRLGREIS
jgi:hypothetical protein